MRPKSWPLYDVWTQIFGKDRATGGVSEDIADGANALRTENAARYDHPNDDPSNDYVVNLDDLFDEPMHPPFSATPESHHSESTGQSEQREQPPKKTPTKWKGDHTDVRLLEFLDRMHSETNKRLDVISNRIGYEFDLGQARQAIHANLVVLRVSQASRGMSCVTSLLTSLSGLKSSWVWRMMLNWGTCSGFLGRTHGILNVGMMRVLLF